MADKIERALGLRPIDEAKGDFIDIESEEVEVEYLPVEQKSPSEISTELMSKIESDETLQDIERARKNIQRIIDLGDESLDEMISLAKQSESPRAFEVASTMMKTLLDANKDFVDMSTRKKYAKEEILNPKEDEVAQTNVTNNNIILSTADLLRHLKENL